MKELLAVWAYLRGKKTYLVAAAAILTAVAKALDDNDWASAWHTIEPALLAMGIRHGIK